MTGDDRVIAMWEMYELGGTLAEVGARFGVSRQRVDQCFREHGIPTRSRGDAAALIRRRATALVVEHQAEIERHLAGGDSLEAIAAALGIPVAALRRHLRDAEIGGRRLHRGGTVTDYTDEQLLACLRRVGAELDGAPGVERYRRYRREHGGLADAGTILKRFGSWSAAVAAAGMTPNRRPASSRMGARTISDEDIRRELWRVASIVGHAPSQAEYEVLTERPSAASIRFRHGGWNAALAAHFPVREAGLAIAERDTRLHGARVDRSQVHGRSPRTKQTVPLCMDSDLTGGRPEMTEGI